MSAWQPFSTAPELGQFLVRMPEKYNNIQVMSRRSNVTLIGHSFDFDQPKPTHWAPLPDGWEELK